MDWQSLTKAQKFLVIIALLAVLPFAPELMLIADIAGIEVLLSCLLIYYRPLLFKLRGLIDQSKQTLDVILHCFRQSAVIHPGIYVTQATFYTLAVVLFGTGTFALLFLIPGFLLPG
ncbi:hypothetical protein [Thalassotalea mangrovi]|uniref:Uncharacterized protein n=1 Tax=Thalassotalea mangrovi TaxID=2572245 RepID=A0A4U1B2W2_9GAMM|nr:hypothetical protein [Thalassotalea mangrovi]TKB43662.1 hypothetical protein E8M12_14420 [Thalassotalea mangrovi]